MTDLALGQLGTAFPTRSARDRTGLGTDAASDAIELALVASSYLVAQRSGTRFPGGQIAVGLFPVADRWPLC
jgi:hypothetical protein